MQRKRRNGMNARGDATGGRGSLTGRDPVGPDRSLHLGRRWGKALPSLTSCGSLDQPAGPRTSHHLCRTPVYGPNLERTDLHRSNRGSLLTVVKEYWGGEAAQAGALKVSSGDKQPRLAASPSRRLAASPPRRLAAVLFVSRADA